MNQTTRILISALAIASLLFGTWRYFASSESYEEGEEEHQHSDRIEMDEDKAISQGITIRPSGPGTLDIILPLRGKVIFHPDRVAHILPKVAGVAKEARKNRGDQVEAGEVVAVLESREMAEAKALYLAALEREKLAESIYQREDKLHQVKVSSEHDYLLAKGAWEEAHINSELAKQKLLALGVDEEEMDLRLYEIRSPLKGTVIDRDITFGEYVTEALPIYTIANLDLVWVEIGVYPKDMQKVKEGQTVEIALPDGSFASGGKLIYISPVIDEETMTSKAIVELDNRNRTWKPGAFVTAKLYLEEITVPLAVAKKAVQIVDGEPIVFIRTEEGFEKTPVTLGRSDAETVEIVSGFKPGAKYASTGAFILKADLGKDSVEHDD